MGIGKILVLGVIGIIIFFVIGWIVMGVSEASKYQGLTDKQVSPVKAVRNAGETQLMLSGDPNRMDEICGAQEQKLIDKFRTDNQN